jgi:tricarballylate dehydrogenase
MRREQCDVLVIGCGAAGTTAGLAAIEGGASVIMLERSSRDERGGNTRWTDANLRLKADHQVSEDFVDAFTRNAGYHIAPQYIAESAQPSESWSPVLRTLPFLDPEVLDAFASNVPATIRWLESHGVRFGSNVYPFIFHAPLPCL